MITRITTVLYLFTCMLAVGDNDLSRSMISLEPGDDEMVVEFERLQHKINEHKVLLLKD